jgi:DNA repair exonuclease SbcCD ATPase subunit
MLNRIQEQLSALSVQEVQDTEKTVAAAEDEAHQLRIQLTAYNERQARIKAAYARVAELTAEKVAILDQMPDPVSEDKVRAARETRDAAWREMDQWSNTITAQKSYLSGLRERLKAEEQRYSASQKKLAEAKEKVLDFRNFKELEGYLKTNRDRYLNDVWNSVLSYASSFVRQATSGGITEIRRGVVGGFLYVEEGHQMPMHLASGMQKAILGMGLKLALGAALGGGRRLLLLDEVTAAAKDENSLLVCGLLAQYPGQVLMVSHRTADTAVADNVILI